MDASGRNGESLPEGAAGKTEKESPDNVGLALSGLRLNMAAGKMCASRWAAYPPITSTLQPLPPETE